jgi:outer membrane protein assembly factor BamB
MGGVIQVWLASTGELIWSFETGDLEVVGTVILGEGGKEE